MPHTSPNQVFRFAMCEDQATVAYMANEPLSIDQWTDAFNGNFSDEFSQSVGIKECVVLSEEGSEAAWIYLDEADSVPNAVSYAEILSIRTSAETDATVAEDELRGMITAEVANAIAPVHAKLAESMATVENLIATVGGPESIMAIEQVVRLLSDQVTSRNAFLNKTLSLVIAEMVKVHNLPMYARGDKLVSSPLQIGTRTVNPDDIEGWSAAFTGDVLRHICMDYTTTRSRYLDAKSALLKKCADHDMLADANSMLRKDLANAKASSVQVVKTDDLLVSQLRDQVRRLEAEASLLRDNAGKFKRIPDEHRFVIATPHGFIGADTEGELQLVPSVTGSYNSESAMFFPSANAARLDLAKVAIVLNAKSIKEVTIASLQLCAEQTFAVSRSGGKINLTPVKATDAEGLTVTPAMVAEIEAKSEAPVHVANVSSMGEDVIATRTALPALLSDDEADFVPNAEANAATKPVLETSDYFGFDDEDEDNYNHGGDTFTEGTPEPEADDDIEDDAPVAPAPVFKRPVIRATRNR